MIVIRAATAADRELLGRWGAALMRQHHAADARRFILSERPEQGYGRFLVSQLDDADTVVLIAERAGEAVGYLYGTLEPLSWRDLRGPCGFVQDVFVAEAARGQGAGRALMGAALAWFRARGTTQVVLWSASGNAGAQRMFATLGFRPTMTEMTLDFEP
jgi:GNAT superfamily N-acetyltransferase